mgnify:CR=1 FL=1
MRIKFLVAVLLSGLSIGSAQDRNRLYIQQYKDIAIREMHQYGIPASITLAQGILESAGGESYLANKANNHFGIKCHRDWKGKKVYRDDDAKNECFRHYKHAEESFRDHSLFLSQRSRYNFLFDYDRTDYKSWAKGLKKAGYATNPKYPSLLIELIERYNLHQYDLADPGDAAAQDFGTAGVTENRGGYPIRSTPNGAEYIIVEAGDTWEDLSIKLTTKVKKLLKYNELRYDAPLTAGQRIFIKKKKNSAERKFYTVREGESTYDIAQKLGIKLRKIYKRNDFLKVGDQPHPGQQVKVKWTLF